ncbi:hypothetical protein H072_1412 [Dactylellina haptotyla CBS 200.50]|uniref:Uncharacterized protein n=1 Tax=Dactylellina haptotyla (strain CBS 200.50) TaxID=1284197 RepID=S8AUH7_DACHA|nr:hypothetical protein H072_1412 [Dactylellina haptotyla CBS 200.50]
MPSAAPQRASDADLARMKAIIDTIMEFKDENEVLIADVFMEIVSRRALPDYYRIIKSPIALMTIQNKLKQKRYAGFKDFINDAARVFHNAKTYNRPSSQIYKDAVTLEGVLLGELNKLTKLEEPPLTAEEAVLPDLGPLPTTESEGEDDGTGEEGSNEGSGDEEDEEEGDGEEEDEDEEMEDADAPKNEDDGENDSDEEEEGNRTRRSSRRTVKKSSGGDDGDEDEEKKDRKKEPKKRGRPPRVDAPYECRIKGILKGIRKFRTKDDQPLHAPFEKLPDIKTTPEYYRYITNPVAIDTLKKKVKRRQYDTVEGFMEDVYTMFDNAMEYNEDASEIYRTAKQLKDEAKKFYDIEIAKPDSDFVEANSKGNQDREPVPYIDLKGDRFVVGDWIELVNPLDDEKHIVAQIFRVFKKRIDGLLGINVCWYYRPENTVHRVNKRFFENEVAKTGQYRDHPVDDIVGRCFVMFYTKASRGRPKNSAGKNIYICEARYNEEKCLFNRIKTWKSCIPDEVRNHPDDTEYWDKQVPLKKFESPIKHLLPADAKFGDKLPKAKWIRDDAPPEGAVYIGARRPNDSPSPEPTPPPKPKSPTPPPPPPPQAVPPSQPRSSRRAAVPQPQQAPATPMAHRQYPPQQQAQLAPMPSPYGQYTPQHQQAGYYQPPQPQIQPHYQQPHSPFVSQMPTINTPGHGHANIIQAPVADQQDMPGEPISFTIDADWSPQVLDKLRLTEHGLPMFHTVIPQNNPGHKVSFEQWGERFSSGGVPLRKLDFTLRGVVNRMKQAHTYGIPFDADQQIIWKDASTILEEFMARERAANSTAMENRNFLTAITYPLEQAVQKFLAEKPEGYQLNSKLYDAETLNEYKAKKRKREAEESEAA